MSNEQCAMMNLSIKLNDRLVSVSDADWSRLFPNLADSPELVRLAETTGCEGFLMQSIVVAKDDRPIVLLPMFTTLYRLEDALEGAPKRFLMRCAKIFPRIFHLPMMGVGFIEGDWGDIGVDVQEPKELLAEALRMAIALFHQVARERGMLMRTFIDFTGESGDFLPLKELGQYQRTPGRPCAFLEIEFSSVDQYLATLGKSTRKDLRRKMRRKEQVSILWTQQVSAHIEQIYSFYLKTIERSSTVFGILNKDFFGRVCNEVPGAIYALYFHDQRLIGFNLLVERNGTLVDKYFGMENNIGREFNLYFLSWLENISFCIRRGLKRYHAGPGSEELKSRLGAEMIPSEILFTHRWPGIAWTLNLLSRLAVYGSKVPLERPVIGGFWQATD
jgi:hypothetical protein